MKLLSIACAGLLCMTQVNAAENEHSIWSMRAEAGVAGYGAAVSARVHPKASLSFGYNGGQYKKHVNLEGDGYDLHLKNNNFYLNLEYRPFFDWQYFALGASYFDPDYYGDRHFKTGETFKIRGRTFQAVGDVKLRGKIKYKSSVVPYLGLGVAGNITKHFGIFAEVGTYYIGSPKVTVQTTNIENITYERKRINISNPESLQYRRYQEAVDKVKTSITDKAWKKWVPSAKVGIVYRF